MINKCADQKIFSEKEIRNKRRRKCTSKAVRTSLDDLSMVVEKKKVYPRSRKREQKASREHEAENADA